MKPRIYTDTSVMGGCEDDEFREPSRRLLEAFVHGDLTLVLSELTLRELELAPEGVRRGLGRVPQEHIEPLSLSSEAEGLAAAYIADGAIAARMRADALHIALATIARNSRLQCGQPQERTSASRNPNSKGGIRG